MAHQRSSKLRLEEIVPSARRTVASLRDIGYDPPRAIADLVDNSLAAGATRVDVALQFDGIDSWIRVSDNGKGMDSGALLEAMRYGSASHYEEDDLGKFGFGLKTASTSQCRRLTVASRRSARQARILVRCLDLDHIERTNKWEVLVLENTNRPPQVIEPLQEHPGTVVLWQDLDRILPYKDPWGEWARRRLLQMAEEVDHHLGMVFHRFLSGEAPGRGLHITVNDTQVTPWDPFCRDEPKIEELPPQDFEISGDEAVGIVRVRPYVLPKQSEFSSDAAWRRASGPSNWNRQQGFYIYRAHRMIQSGGWNRLRTADEHTKLARVALDFFPHLDSTFGINIAKASVALPSELREQLEPLVSKVTRRADQRYRSGEPRGTGGRGGSGGRRAAAEDRGRLSRRAGTNGEEGTGSESHGRRSQLSDPRLRKAIEEAARRIGEGEALERIVKALKERYPEVARELGW